MTDEERKKMFLVEVALSNRQYDHLLHCNLSRSRSITKCPTCKNLWKDEWLFDLWDEL